MLGYSRRVVGHGGARFCHFCSPPLYVTHSLPCAPASTPSESGGFRVSTNDAVQGVLFALCSDMRGRPLVPPPGQFATTNSGGLGSWERVCISGLAERNLRCFPCAAGCLSSASCRHPPTSLPRRCLSTCPLCRSAARSVAEGSQPAAALLWQRCAGAEAQQQPAR